MRRMRGTSAGGSTRMYGRILVICSDFSGEDLETAHDETNAVLSHFGALDAALLERVDPDCVIAPMVSSGFDIHDLAERLCKLNYRKLLIAVCPKLPDPQLLRAEVHALCPGLPFDLHEIGPLP